MSTITTAAVLDRINEICARPATGRVTDRMATLDQLVTAFEVDVEDERDGDRFSQLAAAVRDLRSSGAIVEGAVAAAIAVYAPAGAILPQEW